MKKSKEARLTFVTLKMKSFDRIVALLVFKLCYNHSWKVDRWQEKVKGGKSTKSYKNLTDMEY